MITFLRDWLYRIDRWRKGVSGPPPRDLLEALDMARARFPNDPILTQARAEADLDWRKFTGERLHDA